MLRSFSEIAFPASCIRKMKGCHYSQTVRCILLVSQDPRSDRSFEFRKRLLMECLVGSLLESRSAGRREGSVRLFYAAERTILEFLDGTAVAFLPISDEDLPSPACRQHCTSQPRMIANVQRRFKPPTPNRVRA